MNSVVIGAKWLLIVFVVVLACIAEEHSPTPGFYSRKATPIWDHLAESKEPLVIRSPDGLSLAKAGYFEQGNDEHVSLGVTGAIGATTVSIGPGVGSELLWADDSHAFFVTTSNEGANGSYRLLVVGRFAGVLQMKELTKLIENAFGHPVRCGWPEAPNVAGIAWLPSGDLLAAAEIVNHSNCDSFGIFQMYEIDPRAMKIVRAFNQLHAKAQFGRLLGQELVNAPDECVRNPRSCFVSTNHPELQVKQSK
jgi:hypothetical protein